MQNKVKSLETMLVLTAAGVVVFLLSDALYWLYIGLGFATIGLFVKPVAELISKAWFWLAEMIGKVVSKIILAIVFYLFLFPISLLYRMTHKNTLQLKNDSESVYIERNYVFSKKDIVNPW